MLALQAAAVREQSLVGDAPYHLLAGHQALRYGQNLLNLEHPPLVKWVAALPLLREEPLAPSITVDRALETSLAIFDEPGRLHRVRLASRGLVLLVFGLPFLGACFFLGREAAGPRTGVVLALAAGLAIPVLPNLSILQTDTAVALGFTSTAAAALVYMRRPSLGGAAIVGLGAGLALAAKFSGILVLPAAIAAFIARPSWRRLGHLGTASTVALALVWMTYAVANRRYDPESGRDAIERYCRNEALIVDDRMRPYEAQLLTIERFAPNLAQWLTGLVGIRLQNKIGVYPTYAFGVLSSEGRWWYFPALLLVKTPLAVLLAALGAVAAWAKRAPPRGPAKPVLLVGGVTVAVYLGVAMTSNYNLGVRHLLPILPLLYLPAASWAAARQWRSALLVGVLAAEALALWPLWMSATNTWWLGRHNPTRTALSIGDAEYRQNFVALAETARKRGLEPLYVVYPQVAEKEIRAYLPDAAAARPGVALEPGAWYAVNMSLEQYLPAIPRARPEDVRRYDSLVRLAAAWRPYWREIVDRSEDHGWTAATFHLYRLRD